NAFRMRENFRHMVARAEAQDVERRLQRLRSRPAEAGADNSQGHSIRSQFRTAAIRQRRPYWLSLPVPSRQEQAVKAYLVLGSAIHDLEGFKPHIANVPRYIEKHGGRYVVRGARPESLEGAWSPERMVIIEFPSRESARQFLDDPGFRELAKIRHKTTTSK